MTDQSPSAKAEVLPCDDDICPNFKGDASELERFKPQRGQQVSYKGEPWGTVTRVEDGICHLEKHDGTHTCFIWYFYNSTANGLNNCHVWWK